jgi:ABC-type polysaccharide/polyol phosphate transport system ATPase subunit
MSDDKTVVVDGVSKAYRRRERGRSLADELYRFVTRAVQPQETRRWVLRDVSFELKPGESVGIIGRNGAGKSTLLKILAGIASPTSGTVHVPVRVSTQFALGVGFNPFLTGMENMFLHGTVLGLTNRDVRRLMPDITAFADLGEAIHAPLWTYSTGMSARLAFAIAAHAHADLMLIDEALNAGDAAFNERCRRALEDAKKIGRTHVVVSHSAESIKMLCDRSIWLDQGTIRATGPTREVLSEYLARTVKSSP